MKKSTRAIFITAIALLVIGGSLTAIGTAMGGSVRNWPNSVSYRFFNRGLFNVWSSATLTDENADLSPFTDIRMDTGIGEIFVRYGDTYHVAFINCPMDYISYSVSDGRLSITENWDHNDWRTTDFDHTEIRITVPEGVVLTGLDIAHDLGAFTCAVPVRGDRVSIDLDLGSATLSDIAANLVHLDLDLGSLNANRITADRLTAKLDLGNANLSNVAARYVDVKCNLGDLDLDLIGSLSDYNYDIKVDMGSSKLDGRSIQGSGNQHFEDNNRPYTLKADVDLGSCDIRFIASDGSDPFALLPSSGEAPALPSGDSSSQPGDDSSSVPGDDAPSGEELPANADLPAADPAASAPAGEPAKTI